MDWFFPLQRRIRDDGQHSLLFTTHCSIVGRFPLWPFFNNTQITLENIFHFLSIYESLVKPKMLRMHNFWNIYVLIKGLFHSPLHLFFYSKNVMHCAIVAFCMFECMCASVGYCLRYWFMNTFYRMQLDIIINIKWLFVGFRNCILLLQHKQYFKIEVISNRLYTYVHTKFGYT